MRYIAMIAALLGVAISAIGSASASPNAIAVLDTEQRWVRALAARDVTTVASILDSGFVHVNYQGAVFDRAETLVRAKLGSPYTQNLSDETVHFAGPNVAIVDGINTIEQNGSAVFRLRFTDTFHRVGNTWKAVWAQETAIAK